MALRFGMQIIQTDPWPDILAWAKRYEELGFDSVWLPDHLVPTGGDPMDPFPEAWTMLAALAMGTERVRLGSLVSCNTFRHPAVLAKQVATVDHISGGRVELGIGAGWYAPEHEMFGLDFPPPGERVDRLREAVELIDRFLRNDVTSYDGRFYRLRDAPCRPAPVQRPRPPITIGATGPRMLRLVAERADAWNARGNEAEVRRGNARIDEHCAAIGRDPAEIRRALLLVSPLVPHERPWDSVEAFRDFVGRYRAAGIDEFILRPPTPERLRIPTDIAAAVLAERAPATS